MGILAKFRQIAGIADFRETLQRFPLPLLCFFLLTLVAVAEIHDVELFAPDVLGRLLAALSCCGLAFISLKLYAESHGWPLRRYFLASGAFLLAVLLLFFTASGYLFHYAFLVQGLALSLTVAPYIRKNVDEQTCCHFNCAMITSIFFAGVANVILCAGLSAALLSIRYLFEVKIDEEIYGDIWVIGAACFAPFCALAGFPRNFEPAEQELNYPKGIRFIVSYILSPLVIAYLLILYAYIAKILLQWELPKGNLAYMITTFGAAGVLTHFLAFPLQKHGHLLLRSICRYFYPALLAPVILLWIAIKVRIADYGITEERYAVMLAALWLTLSILYAIATRSQRLKMIPLLASALLILASAGPWSAVSVATKSQVGILQELLEGKQLLVNGKIAAVADTTTPTEQKRISSIVEYLADTGKLEAIRDWFPEKSYTYQLKDGRPRRADTKEIMKDIGVPYINRWEQHPGVTTYFNLNVQGNMPWDGKALSIKPFDDLIAIEYYRNQSNNLVKTFTSSDGKRTVTVSMENDVLRIQDDNGHAVGFDLATLARGLHNKQTTEMLKDAGPMTLEQTDREFSVRMIARHLSGDTAKTPLVTAVHFTLFLHYGE